MAERVTPFTPSQIGFGTVRFSSKGVFDTHKDKMVDPYAATRIPKEAQVEGIQYWPQEKGIFPSIVLLHEKWGLTTQIKEIAARLACEGYVVMVPNLYGRQGGMITANSEVADALVERMNIPDVLQDLHACCEFLNANISEDTSLDLTRRNSHAVIGFGLGGTLAIQFASRRKRLRAAVSFYGKTPSSLDAISNVYCPILYHAAEEDETVTPDALEGLRLAMDDAGKSWEIQSYPGTKHGFFNHTRPDLYDAQAAEKAWESTLEFLAKLIPVKIPA
jgi:carboxymethylenebutenolidase